jgi:hypothetical protein
MGAFRALTPFLAINGLRVSGKGEEVLPGTPKGLSVRSR